MSSLPALGRLEQTLDARTREILAHRRMSTVVRRRGWWVRRALAMADVVGLSAAFLIAQALYSFLAGGGPGQDRLAQTAEYGLFVLSLPVWVVLAKLYGLYSRDEERADHVTSDDFARVFHLVTVVVWLLYLAAVLTRGFSPVPAKLFIFWLASISVIIVLRSVARSLCRRRMEYLQNTIIVGAGDVGQMIARKLLNHPEYGINLVGFVDAEPKERSDDLAHVTTLGHGGDLEELVRLLDVERVIFAFSGDSHDESLELVRALGSMDVQVDIVPRLFEALGPNLQVHRVEGIPLVGLPPMSLSRSSVFVKRALDLVGATCGLVVLAPLLVLLALLVKLDSRGPVFYRHQRIGRHGKPFRLVKFRSMYREACRGEDYGGALAEDEFQRLLSDPRRRDEFETAYKFSDDPRVTRMGRFLRRSSLDELPQLLNVVRGDISLVGPRAITIDELERYGDQADEFLRIRPGVTGYWQVNGRSSLTYDDRIRLDMAYIQGWSLGLDLRILGRTARALLARRGAV